MGFYLLDHPPASRQFYPTRTTPLTGGVAVHTTEAALDDIAPDTGAENVAGFIARRGDPGSYACIVDSDSDVAMVPDDYTAFHIAASGHNSRTWGIALACRTTDLHPDDGWTQKTLQRAAVCIVGFWTRNGFDPASCNRWVPPGRTLTDAGMFNHGDAQPADRTDAFVKHPQRAELQALLCHCIDVVLGQTPEPQEDEDMPLELLYAYDGVVVYSPTANIATVLDTNEAVEFWRLIAATEPKKCIDKLDPSPQSKANGTKAMRGVVKLLTDGKPFGTR